MAGQTITQRIALEGGAAIKQQLVDIGNAGKEAFKNFTDAVKAAPAFADFTANLAAIKAKAAEVGAARRLQRDSRQSRHNARCWSAGTSLIANTLKP
jgi:hypothetical protein